jgi:MoaA/NifB/PqqE/SkfB family radical SAM enzyme
MTWTNKRPGLRALRFARILRAILQKKVEMPWPPLDYYYEVTNRCNIRCRTCARLYDPKFQSEQGSGDMSDEIIKRAIPWIRYSLRVNTGGFGEPFLHAHLFDLMEASIEAGNYVTTISNVTLLSPQMIGRIVDMGLDELVISMDGGTQSVFESIRRGARWDAVLEVLEEIKTRKKKAHARRPRITVEFVALKDNFPTLPDLISVVADRGVRRLHIEPLIRGGNDAYRSFYTEQSLAHIPLDEAKSYYRKAFDVASARSVRLTGPFVKTGMEDVWHYSKISALGYIDSPEAGTSSSVVRNISGWCLHPMGISKVILVEGGNEVACATLGYQREDVEKAIRGNFPRKSECGFQLSLSPEIQGMRKTLEVVACDGAGGKTVLGKFDSEKDQKGVKEDNSPAEFLSMAEEKPVLLPDERGAHFLQSNQASQDDSVYPGERRLPYCTEPWTTCFIRYDGKIFPCCSAQGNPIGDLAEEELMSIWNGPQFQNLRGTILKGRIPDLCANCVSNQRIVAKSIWTQFLPALFPRLIR